MAPCLSPRSLNIRLGKKIWRQRDNENMVVSGLLRVRLSDRDPPSAPAHHSLSPAPPLKICITTLILQ